MKFSEKASKYEEILFLVFKILLYNVKTKRVISSIFGLLRIYELWKLKKWENKNMILQKIFEHVVSVKNEVGNVIIGSKPKLANKEKIPISLSSMHEANSCTLNVASLLPGWPIFRSSSGHNIYFLGQWALSFSFLVVYSFPSLMVWGRNQVYCACSTARTVHKLV